MSGVANKAGRPQLTLAGPFKCLCPDTQSSSVYQFRHGTRSMLALVALHLINNPLDQKHCQKAAERHGERKLCGL